MQRVIYIATNNLHKVQEVQAAMGHLNITFAMAQDIAPGIEWQETGSTFAENARIKASALKKYTSHAVLADDSGLCVDALGGAPGIYSSRYSGHAATDRTNIEKLLAALALVPPQERTARFVCSLCLITESNKEYTAEESCEGVILMTPSGRGGFGYDPLFQLSTGQIMANLTQEQKGRVSHRGKALEALHKHLIH